MVVKVHLFALLRERAGTGELSLTLPAGATIEAAVAQLLRDHPALNGAVARICYAVNRDYADIRTPLRDGDDLALIPPVSGG